MLSVRALTILPLFALCCATCSLFQRPPPLVVEVAADPCLHQQPPSKPAITIAGPENGCPEQFAGCLSAEDGMTLAKYVQEIDLWAGAAWIRCGERPAVPSSEDKKEEAPNP